jgi:hypothetical protein
VRLSKSPRECFETVSFRSATVKDGAPAALVRLDEKSIFDSLFREAIAQEMAKTFCIGNIPSEC